MGKKVNPEDYIGKKFNRLTILRVFIDNTKTHPTKYAECVCDCGNVKAINFFSVIRSHTNSCGCLQRECKTNFVHGMRNTLIYKMWSMMVDRCHNPKNKSYHKYGGRGISVCEQWRKFISFYEDMGDRPFKGAQIDRIDTYGNYEPNNCRWVTSQQNNRNRRDSLYVEFQGKQILVKELAEQHGIEYKTLFARIKYYNMTPEEAVKIPVWANGKNITRLKKQGIDPQKTLDVY